MSLNRKHYNALAGSFKKAALRAKSVEEARNLGRLAAEVAEILGAASATFKPEMFLEACKFTKLTDPRQKENQDGSTS